MANILKNILTWPSPCPFQKRALQKTRNVDTFASLKSSFVWIKNWGSGLVSEHFQYLFIVLGYYHNQGFILPWREGKHHFAEGSLEKNCLQQTNIFWVLSSIPNMNYWLLYWIILSRSMSWALPYIIPEQSSRKYLLILKLLAWKHLMKNRA